jgi:hypothetical protein
MVAVELGKLLEKGAFVRLLDMLLKRQQAARLGDFEYLILEAEEFQIAFLGVARPPQHGPHRLAGASQHGFRVGDDEGADRRADDDDGFEGLP